MNTHFPEANYFIAGSRLRPGMDGGYTVATLRRAQQFAEYGGVDPVLLTFDFWPDYEQAKREFVRIGLMSETTVIRNLLQDARSAPGFLRDRATANGPKPDSTPCEHELAETTDLDGSGRPWRTIVTEVSTGSIVHTDFLDLEGRLVIRVPYVTGRADWHRAPISITVFGADGLAVGTLDGFGELYRVWLDHVLNGSGNGRVNALVCESRQLGELLVESRRSDLRLVHTVHSAHTAAPYEWDSPIDGLWASWLETINDFDAVLWLTERQRKAVERRFGVRDNFWVVPHAVHAEPLDEVSQRDPNLAVMIGRLAVLKRLDHALMAFQRVAAANPEARLAFYGDGPDEGRLRTLTHDYGLQDVVEFHGHRPDAADSLSQAAALVLTSSYEGQGLVVLEALARGCPVVSYDLNYGPSEMVRNGETGILVPNGDVDALTDALASVLGDPERLAVLSAAARASAVQLSPQRSMTRMAEIFRAVIAHPRRQSRAAIEEARPETSV